MTNDPSGADPVDDQKPPRSRLVEWCDPGPGTTQGMSMAGIDYLQAMQHRDIPRPPIAELMQIDLIFAEPGRVIFTCAPDESMYNATGTIHGGAVATLLDTAAGCALLSTLPQGKGLMSVEIKVNYLRAVHPSGGLLTATATVVKAGSSVGFTEGVVTDARGVVMATASSTLLIFDLQNRNRKPPTGPSTATS
jgi:uncharacterized protein (TIGR00369 family)